MKEYSLDIAIMREEGTGPICEMYSKGHHSSKKFLKACEDTYYDECGGYDEFAKENIHNAKVIYNYGKKVGVFENGKRITYTLSESKEAKKGYFPMTKIEL